MLAQIDSSVGGKTGVDFDQYKNMVGAFHQPSLVYINRSGAENTARTISLPAESASCSSMASASMPIFMSGAIEHMEEIDERDPADDDLSHRKVLRTEDAIL